MKPNAPAPEEGWKRDLLTGGCWPTEEQELLLRAALLPGPPAVEAWKEWSSRVDINTLHYGVARLLPLLYRNLQEHHIDHPLMGKLRGTYRYAWSKNQILFNEAGGLLKIFHQAGIETMILKGTALIILHYKDYGARPMEDFDFMVPTHQAGKAARILKEMGWKPESVMPDPLPDLYLRVFHSRLFKGREQLTVDLHWRVLRECCQPNGDDFFWKGAVATELAGQPTLALNATDQLLHVCLHGLQWNPMPPLRWVADAMWILKTAPAIDWERFIQQCRKNRIILPAREALSYLVRLLNAPIPSSVLQQFQQMPVDQGEQIEYQVRILPYDLVPVGLALRNRYCAYLRIMGDVNPFRRLLSFPAYLHYIMDIPVWSIPFVVIYLPIQRVFRKWFVKLRLPQVISGHAAEQEP